MNHKIAKLRNKPAKPDRNNQKHSYKSLPALTASITAILGIITAYTHFFGLSYRKSYLEGAGFEGINISLSADESIYYATKGLTQAIARLLSTDMITLYKAFLIPSIYIAIAIFLMWFFPKVFGTTFNQIRQDNNIVKKIIAWFDNFHEYFHKTIILSIIGFFAGYVLQIVFALVIIFIITFFLVLMYLGIGAGEVDGRKLTEENICKAVDWKEQKNDRVLGCRIIITSPKNEEIRGIRLHHDEKYYYVISNNGAHEIERSTIKSSKRPIYLKKGANNNNGNKK